MARVTQTTPISELRERVRSAAVRGVDRSDRLVRSVQQSLRVEGYEVREQAIRDALRRVEPTRAR